MLPEFKQLTTRPARVRAKRGVMAPGSRAGAGGLGRMLGQQLMQRPVTAAERTKPVRRLSALAGAHLELAVMVMDCAGHCEHLTSGHACRRCDAQTEPEAPSGALQQDARAAEWSTQDQRSRIRNGAEEAEAAAARLRDHGRDARAHKAAAVAARRRTRARRAAATGRGQQSGAPPRWLPPGASIDRFRLPGLTAFGLLLQPARARPLTHPPTAGPKRVR